LFIEEPDFSESDPSQKDGFRVVYDKQCPFEMRLQENDQAPQEVGTLEAITCRVCVQGDTANPTAVRLELSSEQDLFFHFQHTLDERAFRQVREEQRLMIEFQDYASVIARSLNLAIKEPHTHLAVFIQNRDGNARLDFIQVSCLLFIPLFRLFFASLTLPLFPGPGVSLFLLKNLHVRTPYSPAFAEPRVQVCGTFIRVI
jgi:hypothetical protein